MKKLVYLTLIVCVLTPLVLSQQEKTASSIRVEYLWSDGAPGAKGDTENDKPTLTIYLPQKEKANGTSVVICPGGGYWGHSFDHEGHKIAKWLNSNGIAGFIVKYRCKSMGYQHPYPLLDAQRAIRTVRGGAKKFNIDPAKIGIIGFSAGGHLASTTGTHFDQGKPDAKNAIDKVSCRPDFMILVYPVITLTQDFCHTGSRKNLLGPNPDKKLVESLSSELQVTSQTPPAFLFHTGEDTGVPPENSISFYLALQKAKVPAELHIFQKGPHGAGLAGYLPTASAWPDMCLTWLKDIKLIEEKK